MLRAFKVTALPAAASTPIVYRCCEDRLLPIISIFKISCSADFLNGSEIIVIFSHMGIFSWAGSHASKELRAMTVKCVMDARDIIAQNSGRESVPISAFEQGEAPQEFWNLLQFQSEPLEIPTQSIRFTDPILQSFKEPTAALDLSSTTSECINIAVVGGGATGVFCARQMLAPLYRQYLNVKITLFEKSDFIGGMASKTSSYEAACPFFTARSAEFKEFTRRSFDSGYVQPLEMNLGIGEAQGNHFRTFRFAASSFESAEDQHYIYKNSANPPHYEPKSTVPFFYPETYLKPADCFSQIRTDTDSRIGNQKPIIKPFVSQPDNLFHEVHSLSQSMSAGNLWTGRLWRGHPTMAEWFTSLLIDPRITIRLGTEVTKIERLQKRGGGAKIYGFIKNANVESLLGDFDYVAICTEYSVSIKLTKSVSKMMHLALAYSYQNNKDSGDDCDSYHQEIVVEFHPPLTTALDVVWLEPRKKLEENAIGLAFALNDSSRKRLFTTGVNRLRGHSDRIVSMAKGHSYSSPQSHPVSGGHSSVAEGEALRDIWVLYSGRGWNCLGSVGFHFVETLNNFMSTLQKSVFDEELAVKRCEFFFKQCQSQVAHWQKLILENEFRTIEFQNKVQQEYDLYDIKLGTMMQMVETTSNIKLDLKEQLAYLESNLLSLETTKQQFVLSLPQMEQVGMDLSIQFLSLENDLKVTLESAAECRLNVLDQEDKISAATQLFDRDAIIEAANESLYDSTFDPVFQSASKSQHAEWNENPAVVSLLRLDSDVSLPSDSSFRNHEIEPDDVDYLMEQSAKEAREKIEKNRRRQEHERSMLSELSRLLFLSQTVEENVAVQTSQLDALQLRIVTNNTDIDQMRKDLQCLSIDLENMLIRKEEILGRLDKINLRLEFLGADEIALRVEIMQHKQACQSRILTLKIETEVLQTKLIEAQKKHDMWFLRQGQAQNAVITLQQFIEKTCKILMRFETDLKHHSSETANQLCRDAIQVLEQSNYANLRECHGDRVVHFSGQRYIGLTSSALRKSKSKLLRYLANFSAENLLFSMEKTIDVNPTSVVHEPEFVQILWAQFIDLKTKYADFVLANLVNDDDDLDAAEEPATFEENQSKFIQVLGDKIEIDSKGDDFSPLSLLRLATKLCKTCNLNSKQVILEMLASDFDEMFAVMKKYFHEYVVIVNNHSEEDDSDAVLEDDDSLECDSDDMDNQENIDELACDEEAHCEILLNDRKIVGPFFSDDCFETGKSGFFRDSDDDSDFMDDLSIERQKRNKVMRNKLASSDINQSFLKRKGSEKDSNRQSAASLCFDGSSLFDFHTKVCVCGNWLIESSVEGAFLSGSGGANRLMQSIEDDPVMLARLGEDALANKLYSENFEFRSQIQKNSQRHTILRKMAQRSHLTSEQTLTICFGDWRQLACKGRQLSELLKRIKCRVFNLCLIFAFSTWAEATEEQWAYQFSAVLHWTKTLKSRAFEHWRGIAQHIAPGSGVKTISCLFSLIGYESDEFENARDEFIALPHSDRATDATIVSKTPVPLHTDLSNLYEWCRCPLLPFLWTPLDECCLKLPDISGSSDTDLAKLAKQFLKDKPTKQSEYIFRLGWLLYWYRDNNEFAPKSLAAKMALWEEKHLGLSSNVSGQVWPLSVAITATHILAFPGSLFLQNVHRLSALQKALLEERSCKEQCANCLNGLPTHFPVQIMEQSSVIFSALLEFQKQDATASARVWGEPHHSEETS
jgi:hypothetical protein